MSKNFYVMYCTKTELFIDITRSCLVELPKSTEVLNFCALYNDADINGLFKALHDPDVQYAMSVITPSDYETYNIIIGHPETIYIAVSVNGIAAELDWVNAIRLDNKS